MGYAAPQHVEGQPRAGLPFGLFSTLSFRGSDDPHWTNGIEWEAMSCDPVSAIVDPNCENKIEKHFTGVGSTGSAVPFAVYGSAKCGTPGGRIDLEGEERATANLLAREEAQAEGALWGFLTDVAESGVADINPAGALDPKKALAALEGWLGKTYGSLGVLHGSRRAVSLLTADGSVSSSGARLLTGLGTPVAAGSGYSGAGPDGAAPDTGEEWLIMSPALFGYRGPVFSTSALDTRNNDFYALAERMYVIGFDPCGVAAVRMTV